MVQTSGSHDQPKLAREMWVAQRFVDQVGPPGYSVSNLLVGDHTRNEPDVIGQTVQGPIGIEVMTETYEKHEAPWLLGSAPVETSPHYIGRPGSPPKALDPDQYDVNMDAKLAANLQKTLDKHCGRRQGAYSVQPTFLVLDATNSPYAHKGDSDYFLRRIFLSPDCPHEAAYLMLQVNYSTSVEFFEISRRK